MRSKWLKWAGYLAIALVIFGVALQVLAAMGKNEPFIGVNYWGVPIGTMLVLPVLAVMIPVALWALIRSLRK